MAGWRILDYGFICFASWAFKLSVSAANFLIASADFSTAQASELKAQRNLLSSLIYEICGKLKANARSQLAWSSTTETSQKRVPTCRSSKLCRNIFNFPFQLFENSRRYGQKVCPGQRSDLLDISEASTHDFRLEPISAKVILHLFHLYNAHIES
jgi:hypothetical protein